GSRSDGIRGTFEGEAYVFFSRPPSASVADSDGDGSPDDVDLCPNTVIPDPLPGQLRMGRLALANDDHVFDLRTPLGNSAKDITTVTTRGCSCTQIVRSLGHDPGEVLIGCMQSTLQAWLQALAASPGK